MSDESSGPADRQRAEVERLLSGGLATEVEPRADGSERVREIVTRLRTEAGADLARKLVVAGFALHPYAEGEVAQECGTCMYFQTHRRHCELPELELAVEPTWSCRLWRI